jgi:ABC-type nickel/cobalt efflux system permease component RcnA
LLKRLLRGEKFWQAHREHYYQRLVQSGCGHAATALVWYLFMVAGIMLAISALQMNTLYQWLVVVAWTAVLVVAGLCIDRRWRRHVSRSGQS